MTKIEWTDTTWNPVTGCTKVSAGCKNCYAERSAKRLAGRCGYPAEQPFAVTLHYDRLNQPLHWSRPHRVFVNSMSDLFHEDVPDEFIAAVWMRMLACPEHTFQVLTKRPARMARLVPMLFRGAFSGEATVQHNIWLGVSVEDQATADERIPLLLQTPAAVRFVSYEPALGPVNFEEIAPETTLWTNALRGTGVRSDAGLNLQVRDDLPKLDWLIVGGESGPKARPCDVEWIRSVVHQCQAADVAVFVKQLGAVPRNWCAAYADMEAEYEPGVCDIYEGYDGPDCSGGRCRMLRSRKGSDPSEWPADLRVRQWPEVER